MSKQAALFMGTTKVPPEKTAMEIQLALAKAKVSSVQNEYANGEVVAMRFTIDIAGGPCWFRLPVVGDSESRNFVDLTRSCF